MTKSSSIGKTGEKAAADFLIKNGYALLERNFRTRAFEIDIIARDREYLCFVEVKARTGTKKGLPREAVDHAKQQKMIMGANYYLKQQDLFNHRVRFDVVEVMLRDRTPELTLIKNAFGGS